MCQLPGHIKKIIQLSFVFLFYNYLRAQQGGNIFYSLTTSNGLSSNRTTSVIQDRQGFYWIGTLDGLNRFDGTGCKIFQNIEKDSTSLSHNNCINLLEDDKGDIWIATLMGLNRYRGDGKFDQFFFHNPRENFDRVNWIRGMTKDSSGNIWITSCGVWQYNIYTKKWRQWLYDPKDPATPPQGIITHPCYDSKTNCLWMSGSDGFICFDIKSGKFFHKENNPHHLSLLDQENYNGPILLDAKNNIWFFTLAEGKFFQYSVTNNAIYNVPVKIWRGVFNLDRDDKDRIWIHFWYGPSYIYDPVTQLLDSIFLDHYHPQSAISNNTKSLFIDKSGNYWISTWNGISIFNPQAQAVKYYLINSVPHNPLEAAFVITAIAEQNDSILWVGTSAGLYHYNLYQRKLTHQNNLVLPNNNGYVRNLFFQNDSILWISGWTELLCYNIKKNKLVTAFHTINLPQCIIEDESGNIWVGTWNDGLYKLSLSGQIVKHFLPIPTSETIFSNHLVCFGKSNQQQSGWIGYNGGDGFSMINFSQQQFKHYRIKKQQNNFPTYAINCIREDDKKNLWIGTFGRGIIHFNPIDETFNMITQSDGLKGNFINSIIADDSSRLWISTTTGLNILDAKTNEIIQTDIDLSFPGNDFFSNGLVRKNKKLLFFAGTHIVEIDPYSYYQVPKSSEILLSSFKIFDREKYFFDNSTDKQNIKLSHQHNFFSIGYSLLKPNPNSFTSYAYWLQGFDKDWNEVKDRRTAYYTNVPPGHYIFQVKATDENGKWIYFSKPLSVTIAPAYWQRWWFITAIGVFFMAGLYIFYQYRINQLKKILAIRTKISRDLHDEVGATLSSIHIYSSVATKAMNKDAGKTRDALQQINANAQQVMENMSDIVWAINAGNGKEATLAAKLKNYGYDLLTPLNINCIYRIDNEAEKKLVNMVARKNVLLIAKEAINNVAKHSYATETLVSLNISGKYLELEITDNGKGMMTENQHLGNGMNNMKQRMEMMEGHFHIRSEINKGTTVKCSIPLAKISD